MITHKNLKWLVGILILCFTITNCSVSRKIIKPTQTVYLPINTGSELFITLEPTKTITMTILPTVSSEPYTVTQTRTKEVSKTVIPTATINQHTGTPTTTITVTLPPTPNEQTRENIWREAMITPICSLPCWWGIEPGITSWTDAQALLLPLAIYPGSYPVQDGSVKHDSPFNFFESHIINQLELVDKKEIIETIQVNGQGLKNPEVFRNLWKEYAPEIVLQEFGSPSRILIQTWQYSLQPRDPTYKYYELMLFYDQLGFVVLYKGKIENKPNYTVCPTFFGNLIEDIIIYTQSPTSLIPLEKLIGEQAGQRESTYTLQEASGLTIQQFYDLHTKNQESACFDTKADIWPK